MEKFSPSKEKRFKFLYMNKQRSKNPVPQFLLKTFEILECAQSSHLQHIIIWTPQGNAFVLLNQRALTSQVLPHYFKHRNYSSFLRFRNILKSIRQLNMYNFRKQKNELGQNEFSHKYFRRDCKSLLQYIKRRNSKEEPEVNVPQPDLKSMYDLNSKSKEINSIQSTISLLQKLQSTQLKEMEQLLVKNDQMINYYQDLKNSMNEVENSTQVKFSKVNNLVTNILAGLEKEDKYSQFFKTTFLQRDLDSISEMINQLAQPYDEEMKQEEMPDSEYSSSIMVGDRMNKQSFSPYPGQNLYERQYTAQTLNYDQNYHL